MSAIDLTQFDGHTPSPWHECDHHGRRWIETSRDCAVAQIVRTGIRSETVANSALIKSAPELLAEVKRQAAEIERLRAALADAKRKGAEAMREKIAQVWDGCKYDAPGEWLDIGADIRAMPLLTGGQS